MRTARICVIALVFACATAMAETPEQIFKQVSPSVVVIHVSDAAGKPLALGSGVVIHPSTVITNCHVAQAGAGLLVNYRGKSFVATLRYADRDRDLCELSVPDLPAPPVALANTGSLQVGQSVYAIGAPEGLELTLSAGLISALRSVAGLRYIQTTAPISPGSSGGGLFDDQGRLVGITTFYLKKGENLNFALPADWIAGLRERANAAAQAASSVATAAKDEFPANYVEALRSTGRFPEWANYACFDTSPHLHSPYFLLVAYSPEPLAMDAEKGGEVKGVTYQEYVGTQPMNVPPTSSEIEDAIRDLGSKRTIPAVMANSVAAELQVFSNAKAVGVDVTSFIRQPGAMQFLWIMQKYLDAGESDPFGGNPTQAQIDGGQLGWPLYETVPGGNVFRTKRVGNEVTGLTASLIMQPSDESLGFVFVQSVAGHMSLPIRGRCEPISR